MYLFKKNYPLVLTVVLAIVMLCTSGNTTTKCDDNVTEKSTVKMVELPTAGISSVTLVEASKDVEQLSSQAEVVPFTPPATTMQEYIETEADTSLSDYEIAQINNEDVHNGTGYYIVLGRNFDKFTEEEFNLFCRIIMAETEGESDASQRAVGEVVLNRIDSQYFPNTIHEVIYQGNGAQFSPVKDGRINLTPTERVIKNAKLCLLERNHPSNMLFFTATGFFKAYQQYMRIDGTYFSLYKETIYEGE